MTTKPSLLSQHYAILDGHADLDPATQAEKDRIASMRLPDLQLPARVLPIKKRSFALLRMTGVSVLAAAAIAAVLWTTRSPVSGLDDGLRIKGEHQVWVYWERAGEAKAYESGTILESGDRIRAEVLAAEGSVAYWGVTDGSGRLLSDPADVWGSVLRLGPGERDAFSGSFKLVGPSEGETLVVIVCQGQDLPRSVVDDLGKRGGQPLTAAELPSACGLKSFKLR
jgi:hypothetical protein